MCKYCEGHAPLIQTGVTEGHNFDVGIFQGMLICESRVTDNFGINETKSKSATINYCPICGRKLQGKRYCVIGMWIHPHKDSIGESLDDLSYEEAMAVLRQWQNDRIHKNVIMQGENAIKGGNHGNQNTDKSDKG